MTPIIRRTMSAAALNEIANLPEVKPFLLTAEAARRLGAEPLNLAPMLANPANIALEAEHGGWVLEQMLPGCYELHTLFRPEGRGRAYFAAAWEAVRYLFAATDALEIITKCPDDNGGARMAANLMGFRERFRREDAWAPGVGISYRVFSVDDWFVRDPECLAAGRDFHAKLKALEREAGVTLPDHPEDEAHDRAAGAAALMIREGMIAKGVAFYNRWASVAGYPSIAAVGPSTIDMHEVVVEVRGGEMRALMWRPPA